MPVLICPICQRKQSVSKMIEGMTCAQHQDRLLLPAEMLSDCQNDSFLGLILDNKYELHHSLGQGGFGAVYFSIQKGQIRQEVAVKLLTRQDPEYADLFKDEMRVVSKLRSPYTVRYLDSGVHPGNASHQAIPYMVMDYLKGETLAHKLMRNGAIQLEHMTPLMMNLLDSLSEAHEYGIVHRDLKPLNLMITPKRSSQEQLIVLDFGVARVASQSSREATRNRIMGTPYYLAPEVLINQQIDTRGDLFAAGVIFYESLVCRSPFLNEELSGIEPYLRLRSMYKEERKPDPLPKHLEHLTSFFHTALATDPVDRFSSAEDMKKSLQALLSAPTKPIARQQDTQAIDRHLLSKSDYFDQDEVTTLYQKGSENHRISNTKDELHPTNVILPSTDATLMNMPAIDIDIPELDESTHLQHRPSIALLTQPPNLPTSASLSSTPPPSPFSQSLSSSHTPSPPPSTSSSLPPAAPPSLPPIPSKAMMSTSQASSNTAHSPKTTSTTVPSTGIPSVFQMGAMNIPDPMEQTATLPLDQDPHEINSLVQAYDFESQEVTEDLDKSQNDTKKQEVINPSKVHKKRSKTLFLVLTFLMVGAAILVTYIYPQLRHSQWDSCALSYHNSSTASMTSIYDTNDTNHINKSQSVRPCFPEENQCINQQLTCDHPDFYMNKDVVQASEFNACVEAKGCKKRELDTACNSAYQASNVNKKASYALANFCLSIKSAREYCAWKDQTIPSLNAWLLTYQGHKSPPALFEWIDMSPYQSGIVRFVADQNQQVKLDLSLQNQYMLFQDKLHAQVRCVHY